MYRFTIMATAVLACTMAGNALAYETRAYEVIDQDGRFELRAYAPALVAETIVAGDFEGVGSDAFRILAAYISGENIRQDEISMTTPVAQQRASQKIAMTAPVTQEATDAGYRVTFMMPAEHTLETLPQPKDGRVVLREEPGGRFAAVRYSGFWSAGNYEKNLVSLRAWMAEGGLRAVAEPVWARYDPPFMPWFLRKNEILIEVNP